VWWKLTSKISIDVPRCSLRDIPSGTDLFIDANILVYGLAGQSSECRDLLLRCSREEVFGVCLYETVNEATHRFMLAEAMAKRLIPSETARELRSRPGVVQTLDDYWQNTQRVLALNLLFLALDEDVLRAGFFERHASGLLTNNSMIVSSMRLLGVLNLATADADFDRVVGITVYGPSDLTT
jgi:predicted nucleic acid-binding protein